MKKIVFLMIAVFISNIAMSQITDKVTSEGFRVITGNIENVRDITDKYPFAVSVQALQKDSVVTWSLGIGVSSMTPYDVKMGNVLLIKTTQDEVVELKAFEDSDATIGYINQLSTTVYTYYATTTIYTIEEDDLNKLMGGIKKIRQEVSLGENHEKVFKKDKMGTAIRNQVRTIRNALNKKKTIYDDF